jgi:hypothetical protein
MDQQSQNQNMDICCPTNSRSYEDSIFDGNRSEVEGAARRALETLTENFVLSLYTENYESPKKFVVQ